MIKAETRSRATEIGTNDWACAETATLKLLAYCKGNDWAGYDPYDALNSRVFTSLPVLDCRIPRLILTQVLKRSPINVRPLLLVPKTQNPKALALFLVSLLKLSRLGLLRDKADITALRGRLEALRSPGVAHWCWGYSFPWQTRTKLVPRGTPNLVCTTFVANALLDAYEVTGDSHCCHMALSAAEYILKELYWSKGEDVAGFNYPLPTMRQQIHNANFLAAALFCRVVGLCGETKFLEPALKAARYSAGRQREDGAWMYGELPIHQWIDSFHTGYNLCGLQAISQFVGTSEFDTHMRRGFAFYREHFFREDGAARYFHDRTYPIDIHCVAQSIITLLAFADEENRRLMFRVLGWAMKHMWDERGFFYYRVTPFMTIKTSYMRWSQAWMLLALATLNESLVSSAQYVKRQAAQEHVSA